MPEWDEWGKFLSDGLIAAVAALVYALPAILLSCCMFLLLAAASDSTTGDVSGGVGLLACCLFIVIFLIEIPLFLIYGAGLIRYAERGGLRSFFELGALWRYVRANGGQYGYAVLVSFIAAIIGGFVPVLGQVWYQFAVGHAFGQLLAMTSGPDANEMPLGESF